MSEAVAIRMSGCSFAYGGRGVLSDLDLEVGQGETLGILGPNGCGKSTLLALMRGALAPTRGEVRLFGRSPRRLSRSQVARVVAVVPQATVPAFGFSVREFVAMARYAHVGALGGLGPDDRRAVERALRVTETESLALRPVTELSGGELQRVALARAVAQAAPVLLLDEVTSHLDLDHTVAVAELLLRLNREDGTTVVQVSHDLGLAAQTSQRLLLLDRSGRPAALGAPQEVLSPQNLRSVFRTRIEVEGGPPGTRVRVSPVVAGAGWVQTTSAPGQPPAGSAAAERGGRNPREAEE